MMTMNTEVDTSINKIIMEAIKDQLKNKSNIPLIAACMSSDLDLVKLLLNKGADIEVKDDRGRTPLHAACKYGHRNSNMVELLLSYKANVNTINNRGDTPLIDMFDVFGFEADINVVKLLLDHKVNIEAKNYKGDTALIAASKYNYLDSVRLLLDHGANIKAKNKRGHTPLIAARKAGHLKIVELLKNHEV